MNASSTFFKLFPPPAFLTMPHAGLDISDDGIRCIRYDGSGHARRVGLAAALDFPVGLVDSGDVKDAVEFASLIKDFALKHRIGRVRVSIPEEKVYLFETEVSGTDTRSITQNIEFKLEENVPLSAADALFYYALMPGGPVGGPFRASVSVVPTSYIQRYTEVLKGAGLTPVAFEVSPKSAARAVISAGSPDTRVIVHAMRRKVGIYVVSGGVVCFTSTVAAVGTPGEPPTAEALQLLSREIARVGSYWISREPDRPIKEAIAVGRGADLFDDACRSSGFKLPLPLRVGDVWQNSLDLERSLPPISRTDSFDYVIAAGLAFDLGDHI